MPHDSAFYDWKARVDTCFAAIKPHHRAALAQYSFGMILVRCCGLTAVVTHLVAFLALTHALRARLRELYQPASAQIGTARSEFDFTLCFVPLVRWAAGTHTDKRLVLALDPTNLTDRFRVLVVAVLYHGCGLRHKTQMREPVRVARLWAVIAVATLWAVEVGGEAGPAHVPPVRGPLSRLTRGLLRIWSALLNREPMPTGTIQHHNWSKPTATADTLLEPYVHEG